MKDSHDMEKLIVEGGTNLSGEVVIQGAKNVAQKILPATVVFPSEYILRNVPFIKDSYSEIEFSIPCSEISPSHSV